MVGSATHENDPSPPPDTDAIRDAILELTLHKDYKKKLIHSGNRAMVDMCVMAKKAFFHPVTNGSSSIKKVLPAVMQSSAYLRQRYEKPVYGAAGGIPSLNFNDMVWWQFDGAGGASPYTLLPPVFTDIPKSALESMESDEDLEIVEGGAATTAFARLQFDDVAIDERTSIEAAMLRYCELDTLAMVLIYEAWRDWAC